MCYFMENVLHFGDCVILWKEEEEEPQLHLFSIGLNHETMSLHSNNSYANQYTVHIG